MKKIEPKDRIIFAADVGSLKELTGYLDAFQGEIGAVKLGMEILTHQLFTGEDVVGYILRQTPYKIMLDLKFGDIPPTVAGASKEVARNCVGRILGFTVHCFSGKKALADAVKAVEDNYGCYVNSPGVPGVIGVSLLTSLGQSDLDMLGIEGTPEEVVVRLAGIAKEAGVPLIVCSPNETAAVLKVNSGFEVINPGIRFADSDAGDQKRINTPGGARRNGAAYVVMGTDLRKGDPLANARRAAAEITEADELNNKP